MERWTSQRRTNYPVPVIICGGRDHVITEDEEQMLLQVLEWLAHRHVSAGIVVWHGAANGVDRAASKLAKAHGYPTEAFKPAQGELDFLAPTLARNEEMASRAAKRGGGYVIALQGNKGTADMLTRGHRHRLRLIDLRPLIQETTHE